MANRSRRPVRTAHLQDVEMIPITDPAKQAALDRLFRNGKISNEDRRLLLEQAGQKSPERQRKS
jgi:hypothetical protein